MMTRWHPNAWNGLLFLLLLLSTCPAAGQSLPAIPFSRKMTIPQVSELSAPDTAMLRLIQENNAWEFLSAHTGHFRVGRIRDRYCIYRTAPGDAICWLSPPVPQTGSYVHFSLDTVEGHPDLMVIRDQQMVYGAVPGGYGMEVHYAQYWDTRRMEMIYAGVSRHRRVWPFLSRSGRDTLEREVSLMRYSGDTLRMLYTGLVQESPVSASGDGPCITWVRQGNGWHFRDRDLYYTGMETMDCMVMPDTLQVSRTPPLDYPPRNAGFIPKRATAADKTRLHPRLRSECPATGPCFLREKAEVWFLPEVADTSRMYGLMAGIPALISPDVKVSWFLRKPAPVYAAGLIWVECTLEGGLTQPLLRVMGLFSPWDERFLFCVNTYELRGELPAGQCLPGMKYAPASAQNIMRTWSFHKDLFTVEEMAGFSLAPPGGSTFNSSPPRVNRTLIYRVCEGYIDLQQVILR